MAHKRPRTSSVRRRGRRLPAFTALAELVDHEDPDQHHERCEIGDLDQPVTRMGKDDHAAVAYTQAPKGLPAQELDAEQRGMLRTLLGTYLDRVPPGVSPLPRYDDDAQLDAVHLATIDILYDPRSPVTVVSRDVRVRLNAEALGFQVE